MVGRSVQVNSVIFTKKDWEKTETHLLKLICLFFLMEKNLNKKTEQQNTLLTVKV